jgi:MFS family permease
LLAVGSARPGRRAKHFIVVATLLTGFLSALDLTSELTEQPALTAVVATCIPTISSELQSAKREAWIGTAYLWSNVTFTPLYGRLSDLIGRRAAYLQALTLFTIGTLCCGLAPSFTALTVARFVAGMGGGGMGTVSSVLMADLFAPEERGFYQGLSFAMFGAGIGLGGPFGGLLTQYLGWRAAFYSESAFGDRANGQRRSLLPRSASFWCLQWCQKAREVRATPESHSARWISEVQSPSW